MPAIERYQGVMFDAISYPTLSKAGKKNFDRWAIILSGLFGALRPRDLIPNYKLRIDARLPEVGKLDQYWGPHLAAGLKKALRGAIVWDMLPGAHRRAFGTPEGPSAIYTVRFVEKAGGGLKKHRPREQTTPWPTYPGNGRKGPLYPPVKWHKTRLFQATRWNSIRNRTARKSSSFENEVKYCLRSSRFRSG